MSVSALQALGISVEFCAHVVHAFVVAPGTRPERMTAAVTSVGASVLSGITLTKFVGEQLRTPEGIRPGHCPPILPGRVIALWLYYVLLTYNLHRTLHLQGMRWFQQGVLQVAHKVCRTLRTQGTC